MVRIVIAGVSDCPYYANIELLADKLAINLPNFGVTKIVKRADEWRAFANEMAAANKWPILPSPIVWRELVDRGGKGTLIGGANEFQEYASCYYGEVSKLTTQDLNKIVKNNKKYKEQDIELIERLKIKYPEAKKLTIIGADSPTAAHLLMLFSSRQNVEPQNSMNIHLYTEKYQNHGILNRLCKEVEYCSCPSIISLQVENTIEKALKDASIIIIFDEIPRCHNTHTFVEESKISESRNEWLSKRYTYFHNMGMKISECCTPYVKILVAGSLRLFKNSELLAAPINFDLMALNVACKGNICTSNIVGFVKPLEWRLKSAIAAKIGVRCCDIVDLILWGNIDHHFHVDISQTRVYRRHGKSDAIVGPSWFSLELEPLLWDKKWIRDELVPTALNSLSSPEKYSASMCQASAILDFISQWKFGELNSEKMIESLVLISEGSYDVPQGIAFSFPVTTNPEGCFAVVDNIPFDDEKRVAVTQCIKDTLEDWSVIDPVPLEIFMKNQQSLRLPLEPKHPDDETTLDIPVLEKK